MLKEWFTYLTTPCPGHFRRMGYLREAVSLASRYKRCAEAWAPHVENCRAVVRKAMDACPGRGRAVVLGSGLAVEVPIDEMARRFDDVVLIDIVHLHAARHRVGGFENVRLVEDDVSGILHAMAPGAPLPTPKARGPEVAEHADLVVSVGLASQLPLLPLEYVGRDDGWFAAGLIQGHLDWLAGLDGTVCLITDVERQHCRNGKVVETEDALAGVAPPPLAEEWVWDIAPAPEAMRDTDLRCRVKGDVLS
jgi:hypothetical protein